MGSWMYEAALRQVKPSSLVFTATMRTRTCVFTILANWAVKSWLLWKVAVDFLNRSWQGLNFQPLDCKADTLPLPGSGTLSWEYLWPNTREMPGDWICHPLHAKQAFYHWYTCLLQLYSTFLLSRETYVVLFCQEVPYIVFLWSIFFFASSTTSLACSHLNGSTLTWQASRAKGGFLPESPRL